MAVGAILILHLDGDLDAAIAELASAAVLRADRCPAPDVVIVDLTAAAHLPAAAVRALDELARSCAERGIRTRLVTDHDSVVRRVVQLAELDRRIPLFVSRERTAGSGFQVALATA